MTEILHIETPAKQVESRPEDLEEPHKHSIGYADLAMLIRNSTNIVCTAVTIGALLEDKAVKREDLRHEYDRIIHYVTQCARIQNISIHIEE